MYAFCAADVTLRHSLVMGHYPMSRFAVLVMDIIPTPRAGRIPSAHLLGGLEVDPHQRRHVLSRHSTTTVPHRRDHLAGGRKRSDTGGLGACTTKASV